MLDAALALFARIMMAGIFLWDAWLIANNPQGTSAYMEQFGVPGVLMPVAALFQLAAGALLVVGWKTRPAAVLLAGYAVATAVIFHARPDDAGELLHFGKNFAMAGGFLFLCLAGPGRWSVDGWPGKSSGGARRAEG